MALVVPHPNLEPWRQEALNLGYGMAASFPLICRTVLLGTLTIPQSMPSISMPWSWICRAKLQTGCHTGW